MSGKVLDVWQDESYYRKARAGSQNIDHPGMQILQNLAKGADSILDLGCGEGTRLSLLSAGKKNTVGVDISPTSIKMARKSFPGFRFEVADLENLPFEDGEFRLVYSAFVLEHLQNPENVLQEAVRVTSPGGYLVLVAPNFGAPNRASPPFTGSRMSKLLSGLGKDLFGFIFPPKLFWHFVTPIARRGNYDVDWDATVEPYLGSLQKFIASSGMRIRQTSSCWPQEQTSENLLQRLFKFLGENNLYPFWMWGPHLLLVAEKIS